MTPTDETDGQNKNLDRWLDEMAGGRPASDDATRALRETVMSHADQQSGLSLGEAATPEAQLRASSRLRERLRAISESEAELGATERLGTVRAPGGAAANSGRWRLAAGLGVFMLAVGVIWQLRPSDEGDFAIADSGMQVWRNVNEPLELSVEHPVRAAQALARQVAPFDARPLLYRQADSIAVDLDVQPARIEEIRSSVADLRIKVALRAGSNRIVFSKSR